MPAPNPGVASRLRDERPVDLQACSSLSYLRSQGQTGRRFSLGPAAASVSRLDDNQVRRVIADLNAAARAVRSSPDRKIDRSGGGDAYLSWGSRRMAPRDQGPELVDRADGKTEPQRIGRTEEGHLFHITLDMPFGVGTVAEKDYVTNVVALRRHAVAL